MINKIEELVKEIELNTEKTTAFLQIVHDENEYGTEIEGNYQGVRLFAAELLRKSIEMERGYSMKNSMLNDDFLVNGNAISLTSYTKTRDEILEEQKVMSSATNSISLKGIGCIITLLFLLTLFIFGIIYFVNLF